MPLEERSAVAARDAIAFVAGMQAQQQIAAADERGEQRNFAHAAALIGFEQHACVARVRWDEQHASAGVGDRPIVQRAEVLEQKFGSSDATCVGLVEKIEISDRLHAE